MKDVKCQLLQRVGQLAQEPPGTEALAGILKGIVTTYSAGTGIP